MIEKNYENIVKGKEEEEKPQKYLSPRISFRGLGLVRLFEPDLFNLKIVPSTRRD
jgi:hypothetical protein